MRCLSPVRIKQKGQFIDVKCNQCQGCIITYQDHWKNRGEVETRHAYNFIFITLTFKDECLEYTEYTDPETGEITLYPNIFKSTLQNFYKRLRDHDNRNRKKQPLTTWENKPIPRLKYLGSAEHGEHTQRPHYHSILWNLHPETLKNLDKIWSFGEVHEGKKDNGAVRYILSHQAKAKNQILHECQNKSFTLKSNGIGEQYIPIHKKSHLDSDRQWMLTSDKVKASMPTYYRNKIFEQKPTAHKLLKLKHESRLRDFEFEETNNITVEQAQINKIESIHRRNKFFGIGKTKL